MNKTKSSSKKLSATPARASRAAFLALSLLTAFLVSGCVSRKKIEAAVWATNAPIPQEICLREPEVAQYGFYRRLNNGQLEFVSWCSEQAAYYVTMYSDDFERVMNEAFGTRRTRVAPEPAAASATK